MNKSIFPMVILAATLFAACTADDVVDNYVAKSETKSCESNEALTGGYNAVIFSADSLDNSFIPLGNGGNVSIESSNPQISCERTHQNGKDGIRIVLNGDCTTSVSGTLTVKSMTDASKVQNLDVCIRPELMMTRASTADQGNKAIESLGRVFNPYMSIYSTRYGVFDENQLKKYYSEMGNNVLDVNTTLRSDEYFKTESSTYNSHLSSLCVSYGVKVEVPIKKVFVQANISGSTTKTHAEESSYEYMDCTQKSLRVQANLLQDGLLQKGSTKQLPWLAVTKSTTNNMLNNPGSAEYKNFTNTTAGIDSLIDYLGGYNFNSAVLMGGECVVTWSKKKTMTKNTFAQVFQAVLNIRSKKEKSQDSILVHNDGNGTGSFPVTKKILYNKGNTDSPSGELSFGVNKTTEDIIQQMDIHTEAHSQGGTFNPTTNVWSLTEDVNQWVPVGFCTLSTMRQFESNSSSAVNPDVHSILELCIPGSDRYNAIKAEITPNADGEIPYHQHKNAYGIYRSCHYVVVDVIMDLCDPDAHYPMSLKDQNGKTRLYYPLVCNVNGDRILKDVWHENVFAVNTEEFVNSGWTSGARAVTILYAMDWEDNTTDNLNGITDIFIGYGGKENKAKGIYRRGIHSDRFVNASASGGSRYLYVQYADENTPASDKITGICAYFTKWDGDNGDARGVVFAASAGTDLKRPIYSAVNKAYFNSYWDKDRTDWVRKEAGWDQDAFIKTKNRRPHTAMIGYTKQTIRRDISGIITDDAKGNSNAQGVSAQTLKREDPYFSVNPKYVK